VGLKSKKIPDSSPIKKEAPPCVGKGGRGYCFNLTNKETGEYVLAQKENILAKKFSGEGDQEKKKKKKKKKKNKTNQNPTKKQKKNTTKKKRKVVGTP